MTEYSVGRPDKIRMAWSYDNLKRFPPASFACPIVNWDLLLSFRNEVETLPFTAWRRIDGYITALRCEHQSSGRLAINIVGGLSAAVAKIDLPDEGVHNAMKACLADLFVMREPVIRRREFLRRVLSAQFLGRFCRRGFRGCGRVPRPRRTGGTGIDIPPGPGRTSAKRWSAARSRKTISAGFPARRGKSPAAAGGRSTRCSPAEFYRPTIR